jgi:Uma2 family endonuclease
VEEYIELERKAEYKSEYYKGEIFALARASRNHCEVSAQLHGMIGQHLHGSEFRCYGPKLRIATPGDLYTYPDLSIVRGEPKFSPKDRDTLINPTLLVEILSPTEEYGHKIHRYREIESIYELLFVWHDAYDVDLYTRRPDGSWLIRQHEGPDAVVDLSSIGYSLRLSELYERVVFEEQTHG